MSDVKITSQLFEDLIRYHLLDERDPKLIKRITDDLEEKLHRLADHERYSTTVAERIKDV